MNYLSDFPYSNILQHRHHTNTKSSFKYPLVSVPETLQSTLSGSPRHTKDRHNFRPRARRSACNTGSRWSAVQQVLPLPSPPHASLHAYGFVQARLKLQLAQGLVNLNHPMKVHFSPLA